MRRIHLNQVSWTIKRKLNLHGFNIHKIEEKKHWQSQKFQLRAQFNRINLKI